MRIDELEELLGELDREGRRPKFIYSVPTFQNPGGVTLSLERRRRLVEIAREREILVVEDNPYGLLRYEGDPLPPLYSLDGGDYVLYLGTFSKILSPGIRLGWVCAPPPVMAKLVLGKQAADLCTSTLSQYFVREYFGEGRWREYVAELTRVYRARRDAMLDALSDHFPRQASWSEPAGRPVRLGDDARLHRHRPTCSPRRSARTSPSSPARRRSSTAAAAARCGSTSRPRPRTRSARAIRRIGAVVDEQVNLYETMTGTAHPVVPSAPGPGADAAADEPIRRARRARSCRSIAGRARAREGRGPEGRTLARAGRLAALRRPGRGRARARSATRSSRSTPTRAWSAGSRPSSPTSPSSPCTGPAARTAPSSRCSSSSASPTPAPASPRACSAWTRSRPSTGCARRGSRRPTGSPSAPTAFRELGAADAFEEIEARLGLPLVVKPAGQGSALGVRFAAAAGEVPAGLVAALSYDDRVLIERHVAGRELAVVGPRRRGRCRSSRRSPSRPTRFNYEARYEIGRTRYVCPAELSDERDGRGHRRRPADLGGARLRGLRPRRRDARRRRAARRSSRSTRSPASPTPRCPDGRRGGGDRLRALRRAGPRAGSGRLTPAPAAVHERAARSLSPIRRGIATRWYRSVSRNR